MSTSEPPRKHNWVTVWLTLRQARATDPASRRSAIRKLGCSRSARAPGTLLSALDDDDEAVREEAVEALGRALGLASALADRPVLLAAQAAVENRIRTMGADVLLVGMHDAILDALTKVR
jgi:HEAT repeat protein